jgi:hypothetical protein
MRITEERFLDFVGFLNDLAELIGAKTGKETSVNSLRRAAKIPASTAYYYDQRPGRTPAEVLALLQAEAARLGCELDDASFWALVKGHLPAGEIPSPPASKRKTVKKSVKK